MSIDDKAPYFDRADELSREYVRLHPEWKFVPSRETYIKSLARRQQRLRREAEALAAGQVKEGADASVGGNPGEDLNGEVREFDMEGWRN
jgi:hypothetical protein